MGTEDILKHVAGKTELVVITTHDLALAELAQAPDVPADRFVLAHFADDAGSDDLAFDYKIRDGIVTSTNALKVMKTAGFACLRPWVRMSVQKIHGLSCL